MSGCDLDVIKPIAKQFLSGLPIKDIQWGKLQLMTWNEQENLIQGTIYFKPNVLHPLRLSYQKAFVKAIIDQLENHQLCVHDIVFEAYGQLLSKQDLNYCYRHFVVPSGGVFSFQENVNIISQGTTGLSTWQGGIALAEWCIANRDYLMNKSILELGSGVGLTGLIALLICRPMRVFLTDCHDTVLQNLCKNVTVNLAQNSVQENAGITAGVLKNSYMHKHITRKCGSSALLEVVKLPWEDVTPDVVTTANPSIVLAADVVYDSSIFVPLIKAFKAFLELPNCQIILACTERNENTLKEFLSLLGKCCDFIEEPEPQQNVFCWSRETPIRIFTITRH